VLSVLFVCTGNICRSPVAEALLQSRAGELGLPISVRSAGSWAHRGNPATSNAIRAARELGVEIEGHRARPLDDHLIRDADLVLALAREHRDEILYLVSEAAPKTFTLKELAALLEALLPSPVHADRGTAVTRIAEADRLRASASGPLIRDPDVRDPIGSALFAYRDVAWDIQTAIDSVLIGLFGGSGGVAGPERSSAEKSGQRTPRSERDRRGAARAASSGEG
jgi:protein-tyrosine phosphatase